MTSEKNKGPVLEGDLVPLLVQDWVQYRRDLMTLEQKAQEKYDTTVVYLSSGALGISFAFVDNFIKEGSIQSVGWLIFAWVTWGLSVTMALGSFYTSAQAMRRTIKDIDAGKSLTRPGGWYDMVTIVLNLASGMLFLAGVVFLTTFIVVNL